MKALSRKPWWHMAWAVLFSVMTVACGVAMLTTLFLKDEPFHIALAYLAGVTMFADNGRDELHRYDALRRQQFVDVLNERRIR